MAHTFDMASNDTGTARLTDTSTECPLCGGTGWKMVDVVDQFGRNSQKATKCDCQRRIHGERLLEQYVVSLVIVVTLVMYVPQLAFTGRGVPGMFSSSSYIKRGTTLLAQRYGGFDRCAVVPRF